MDNAPALALIETQLVICQRSPGHPFGTLLIVEGALGLQLILGIGAVGTKILLIYLTPVVAGMLLHRLSFPVAATVARIAVPISKAASLLLLLLIAVMGAKPLIALGAR
jgi:hypothetical protein